VTDQPRVGVSACLLGQPVRYDGKDKNCMNVQSLTPCCELVPVCPEVGMGLPVPRPPIQVWQSGDALGLRQVENPAVELAPQLQDWYQRLNLLWHTLDGFVLKSRSPSCGHGSTPLHDISGEPVAVGDGLFVTLLRAGFPYMPLIDEVSLQNSAARKAFMRQVIAHYQQRIKGAGMHREQKTQDKPGNA